MKENGREQSLEKLALGLEKLKLTCGETGLGKLMAFLELLSAHNRKVNLVSRSEEDGLMGLVAGHLLDSLAPLPFFKNKKNIIDIGSGGGLPALPLAILCRGNFSLVESKAKKCAFLESAVKELKLTNVKIIHKNIQEVKGKFDALTARAFGPVDKILKQTRQLCGPGSVYLLYKGRKEVFLPELKGLKRENYDIISLHVPFLEAERHLIKIPWEK